MIRLHYSNRLENLIEPLAAAVAQSQRADPLDPITIVVPNRVVEQFVRYRLSERNGIAANLRFPFLRTFLADVLRSTDPGLTIIDADDLQLVVFECLRSSAHRNDPALKPARDYVEAGSKTDADVELRTLLLAAQLARLFREYSLSRGRMIAKWRAGNRADLDAMDETERWQRHLWQLVFDSHGRLREEWLLDRDARVMLLPDAFDAAADARLKSALPSTLHVFGSPYIGSAYANIFGRLATLGDIRIYAPNPCREFWEDVDTSRRAAFSGLPHHRDKVGDPLGESDDPFGLNASTDPLALRLWGRPGREYIRMLNELSQCDFVPLFSDPSTGAAPTLLESLQQSILDRNVAPGGIESGNSESCDERIRFLACPGIRREAEIVANEIWSLISQNDRLAADCAADHLRFHEIAVLIPDSEKDDYLADIESVFQKQHRIPIDLVSRSLTHTSRVAEAVDLLLRLPAGNFSRAEMIRLLTHPALNGDARIDVEAWPLWSDALGIFFGADDDDLKSTYIPRGLYHWDQALKRLALGTMMTGGNDGEAKFYEAGANSPGYLPLEVAQDELETAARFIRGARSLIADSLALQQTRLKPHDWSRMLLEFVNAYIRPESAVDEQVRDAFLAAIESVAESPLKLGPISYESAREVLAPRIAELDSRRGQYSGHGVAVGSFSSLRSIPFKVIFVLGLNEALFPEREHRDPLDLRALKRVAGDVTPAERDRYLFLETLLAARERIYLSYVARDVKSGDALEPSSVIRELQSMLRTFVDKEALAKLTVSHPVNRYDLKYFLGLDPKSESAANPALVNYDSDARRGARMLALRSKIERQHRLRSDEDPLDSLGPKARARVEGDLQYASFEPLLSTQPSPSEEIALPIAALRRYLECPLQGAARYALGMLADEDPPEETDDEPVEQSRLDRTMMLRNVFWRAGGKLDLLDTEYAREVRVGQAHGRAAAGRFAQAAEAADDIVLRRWISQAAEASVNDFDRFNDIRIGRADEFADAATILPPIVLDAEVRRHDGNTVAQRVSLYGTIRGLSPDAGVAITCVLRKSTKPGNFLAAFLNAIALAAAGVKLPALFWAIVVGTEAAKPAEWIREFRPMDGKAARAYLTEIVSDLLSAGNDYFLPIEAVVEVDKERRKPEDSRDLVEAVERVLLNDFHKSSSEYGPVRNATSFDPPAEEEIERIFQRRYEPIIGIFK